MEILEKREVRMQGNDGLYTKHRYYDPQERSTFMEEVLFVNRNDTVYRLNWTAAPIRSSGSRQCSSIWLAPLSSTARTSER